LKKRKAQINIFHDHWKHNFKTDHLTEYLDQNDENRSREKERRKSNDEALTTRRVMSKN